VSGTRALLEFDRSAVEFLVPGQTVLLSQPGRARKSLFSLVPQSTLEILEDSSEEGRLVLSTPLAQVLESEVSPNTTVAVRPIGRHRVRFEVVSGGVGLIPEGIRANDWVLIGNGDSYAGAPSIASFAPANQGWFQIRETDNEHYFDIDGAGVEEMVVIQDGSLLFVPYHSARVGDQIVIGFDSPVSSANKGTFEITSVTSPNSVRYKNPMRETQGAISVGVAGAGSISVLDQGYTTYRTVALVAPKPSDPTNRALVVVEPGYDLSLISEGQGAKLRLPNRLGFGTDPVTGVAGYSFWNGLKRRAQRVVDGYEPDASSFPGVAAAGVSIEVREPQIQRIKLAVKVKTSRGVSLQALSDTIKAAISGYVNALGLGQDVVMSEVIRLVQEISGVEACVLVHPEPGTERITVGDSSLARISAADMTLS
jgi:hypothetical protein